MVQQNYRSVFCGPWPVLRPNVILRRNVGLQDARLTAAVLDGFDHGVTGFAIAVADNDLCTLARECHCCCPSDARAAARYECNFSVKVC